MVGWGRVIGVVCTVEVVLRLSWGFDNNNNLHLTSTKRNSPTCLKLGGCLYCVENVSGEGGGVS